MHGWAQCMLTTVPPMPTTAAAVARFPYLAISSLRRMAEAALGVSGEAEHQWVVWGQAEGRARCLCNAAWLRPPARSPRRQHMCTGPSHGGCPAKCQPAPTGRCPGWGLA